MLVACLALSTVVLHAFLKVGLLLNSNRFICCHDKGLMSFEQGKRDFLGMSVVVE